MIGFGVLAVALVATAVFTISARSPVHSVVGLLANFAALAMLYLTLQAEFLAIMQIVVYSGAILILFVFVIALLTAGVTPFDVGPDRLPRVAPVGVVLALVVIAGIAAVVGRTPVASVAGTGAAGDANVFGSVADFGRALFTVQLLPFEVTAIILLIAVIGVVLIAGDTVAAETPPRRNAAKRRNLPREPIAR